MENPLVKQFRALFAGCIETSRKLESRNLIGICWFRHSTALPGTVRQDRCALARLLHRASPKWAVPGSKSSEGVRPTNMGYSTNEQL